MNFPTIIALSVTVLVVAGIIALSFINRKKGKGGCSCGCGGCANRELCHSYKKSTEDKE